MKIGISVNPNSAAGYGRFGDLLYKKIKDQGYDAIDYSMTDTDMWIYTEPWNIVEKRLQEQKENALEQGVLINQTHGPWRWPANDSTEYDRCERLEKMQRSIRATKALGSRYFVIHPIMPFGTSDIGTGMEKETRRINLEFFRELLKTAKDEDVIICLENMPFKEFSLSKPEDILGFVEEFNDENFRICLDTGHVSVFDALSLEDEVKRLGNKIKALHVHDNKIGIDLHLMPYYGVIDWQNFGDVLAEIGFDGVFSLETAPPTKLSEELFEEAGRLLYKIASDIIKRR